MEYDVSIEVTKLVRGKGLCEQLSCEGILDAKQSETALVLHLADNDDGTTSWLKDMVHFLKTSQCPLDLDKAKRRYYRL